MKAVSFGVAMVLAAAIVGDPVAQTITVPAGGDLQAALDRARPGDTILLERGASYVGNFVMAAREGNDARVITLRTGGDADLPAEGQRIVPADAPFLARLRSPNASPVLRTAPGARGWRIALIEFQANRDPSGSIIALGEGAQTALAQVPSQITLDRLYIHGDPERGQRRGVALNSASTTITGCYISDIKTIGSDSQGILGWNGPGDYVIENNYIEAAGENVMFGGGDPAILNLTPTGIVIRDNVMSKPLAWREAGAPNWQIKNIFELKNARDVVVEHNVLERSWQQAQSGYAVLFTVRNQDGGCGWCQLENIQFRGNLVRDVAAGIQVLGIDPNYPSRQTNRIVISDNVFDGIDKKEWGGDGYFMLLSDAPRDVTVDHNTIVQRASGGIIRIAHGIAHGITFTNNIAAHGDYGIIGSDRGIGNDSITAYLPGATIANNVIAGGNRSAYPAGNLFPGLDEFRAQFVNLERHDYHLVPRSAWRGAGSDGRDLGANVDRVPGAEAGSSDRRPATRPITRPRR